MDTSRSKPPANIYNYLFSVSSSSRGYADSKYLKLLQFNKIS